MQKFMKAIAAIMLTVAVVIAAGCTKPEDPNDPNNGGNEGGGNNGGDPTPTVLTEEGIYLGIIGFNNKLYPKDISLLNNSTKYDFTTFIDGLTMADNTKLYYADYTALQKLKSYGEPPKLTSVALVTFTDGLDNASLAESSNPENHASTEAYIASVHNKIQTDMIHGHNISAYSIGLKGNDVVDVERFRNDLKMLASNDNNVFEVASMNEALERFSEIAESLHSITTTASLSVLVPPGYNDGKVIRFTFDNISTNEVENSTRYIECTYRRPGTGRRLENIVYHGFQDGASSLTSNEMDENESYRFVFENLVKSNGEIISPSDTTYLKLYRKISTGWEPETEFKPSASSQVNEEQSSALIMLVLDCTTSLGSEFSSLKTGAKRFVATLVNSNNGGGGGGNTQYYDISVSANPSNGGTVTGGGTYQQGNSCTVKATANSGYTFSKWTENGSQVSTNANYTFNVTGDRSLVAHFNYNGGGFGEETLFTESFANGQGQFTIHNVSSLPEELSEIWNYHPAYSCMYASGYSDLYAQSYNTESWLVSPYIELSGSNSISLQFDQAVKFAPSPQDRLHVMISTNFNGQITQATWTELNLDQWPLGNDWVFITSTANLSSFANHSIVVAFKYTSTTSVSPAWELRNIEIKAQ